MHQDLVFSVSEFNEAVSRHLSLLGSVVVEGEIMQLKVSQGKWIYLTLKDDSASVEVFSMVFKIHNLNSLEEGMKVQITGTPGMYQKTGRFSLQADQIIPSGEGALKLAYEKLKGKLEDEGLFAIERKRPLPRFPQHVGLLTAKGSQSYQDFVKVTNERIGGVTIYFYPVQVQGNSAVSSVINGLKYFQAPGHEVDLLVITRGGGSLEDLLAFNDERLVRAVYASPVPTVCAIGHEGDVSLVELAADLRGSTPSNAAELIFRHRREVVAEIVRYEQVMSEGILGKISAVERDVRSQLFSIDRHLERSFAAIERSLNSFAQIMAGFTDRLEYFRGQVDSTGSTLSQLVKSWLTIHTDRVVHLGEKLNALDPTAVLKRGYSILTGSTGAVIRSIKQVNINETIVSLVSDGTIESLVQNTKKGDK